MAGGASGAMPSTRAAASQLREQIAHRAKAEQEGDAGHERAGGAGAAGREGRWGRSGRNRRSSRARSPHSGTAWRQAPARLRRAARRRPATDCQPSPAAARRPRADRGDANVAAVAGKARRTGRRRAANGAARARRPAATRQAIDGLGGIDRHPGDRDRRVAEREMVPAAGVEGRCACRPRPSSAARRRRRRGRCGCR